MLIILHLTLKWKPAQWHCKCDMMYHFSWTWPQNNKLQAPAHKTARGDAQEQADMMYSSKLLSY